LGDRLGTFRRQGLLDRGVGVDFGELSLNRNQSWNVNLGLFSLEIARDLAGAFLIWFALTVS
jgi:hypothetical protein